MQTAQEGNATQAVKVFPGLTEAEMRDFGLTMPPTQDELPYSDGMPMESNLRVLQMYLLIETLKLHWEGRQDVFVGGNMFVYFSPRQEFTQNFAPRTFLPYRASPNSSVKAGSFGKKVRDQIHD